MLWKTTIQYDLANIHRDIAFYSTVMLFVTIFTLMVGGITDGQVDKNTLESIFANQTRSASNDVAQINMVGSPKYLFDASTYNKFYVINSLGDEDKNGTISVIDTVNSVVTRNIPVGISPMYIYGDLSVSPIIYLANWGSQDSTVPVNGTISVIDTRIDSVIENISVGIAPEDIYGDLSVSPLIYVVNSGAETINNITKNAINVIDTSHNNTIIKNISIPGFVVSISIDPYSKLAYIAENNNFGNIDMNGTLSVLDVMNGTLLKSISVGKDPTFIFNSPRSNEIYVANFGSNTVSIINNKTFEVTDTIPMDGRPDKIYGNLAGFGGIHPNRMDYIYVTYPNRNYTSIIDTWNNTVVQNLTTDSPPSYIYLPSSYKLGYITNYHDNTISIFDRDNSSVIKDIPVGIGPVHILGGGYSSDALYVANSASSGISLINSVTNEVVSRVTFNVIPSQVGQARSGNIICNGIEVPLNQFFYISSGSKCIAKPSKGFEFASWVENLGGNLTRTVASASGSPWTAFLDAINIKQDDPVATLTVDRFGSFTAYFRILPPAIHSEYLVPLYGIVISTVVGLSTPSIITWRKTKKQTSMLNSFHLEMTSLYDDGRLDERDTSHLNRINKSIINAYSEGKINNEQYTNLKNEISALYEEIYKKRIVNRVDDLHLIQEDISDAYSKGKITKLHYDLLNEKISKMT